MFMMSELEVYTEEICLWRRIIGIADTFLKHTAVVEGTLGVHTCIFGNGEEILCREIEAQVEVAEPFLRECIAYGDELAAEVRTILYKEARHAAIVLVKVGIGETWNIVACALAVPSF